MEKVDFNTPLLNALEGIKSYFAQQITYNKLLLSKKMTELSARLVLFLLIFGLSAFILFFLSFAFAHWYAYYYGEMYIGYLILAAFYFIFGVIIFIFRKPLIFQPIRKITGGILFSDVNNDSEITAATFDSKGSLNIQIKKALEDLNEQETNLKDKFDQLSQKFTLTNIAQQFARNAYSSILTTSNIAKLTYFLVQKLKRKKKPKQIKD